MLMGILIRGFVTKNIYDILSSMAGENPKIEFRMTSDIDDITIQCWDRIFPGDIIEGFGYHKTIEESGTKEFRISYLVGEDNKEVILLIPFFINDFSFTTVIQGPLQKLMFFIQKIFKRAFKAKMLFVGLPTAEELYIGVDKSYGYAFLIERALQELSKLCAKERIIATLFYNLTEKHQTLCDILKKHKFASMEDFPNTFLTIKEKSCEDYIEKLSKNTRKDIRKKLNRLNTLTRLETEVTEDISNIKNRIYELYMNNFEDSDIHFETLTMEFFENIAKNMEGVAKFFITRDHTSQIVAFNLCFVKNNTCIDKVIGLDKDKSRLYHLYNATLIHNIGWCIKNNITYYQLGITDYHAKLRFGASLTPLFIYVKINNRILNAIFTKPIAKLTQPKNFDPVLKRLERKLNTKSLPTGRQAKQTQNHKQ